MGNWNPGGHWNQNGNWIPKQRDAPWRDHPNFHWTEPKSNQPPQPSNNAHPQEKRPHWPNRNNEGQNNLNNRGQGNQPNWSSKNQQNQYVLPHQHDQEGNQGPSNHFNSQQGPSGQYNQSSGVNQHGVGSGQPYPRQQQRQTDDLVGELLNSQQNLQNNMMSNNDVVHRLQDAQQEQKTAMDMLTRQLSQIATSINKMRGNDGKIPATVKMPGRENVSLITLRSSKAYEGPPMKVDGGPSGKGDTDRLIKETALAEPEVVTEERKSEEKREEKVGLPQGSSSGMPQTDRKIMVDENISAVIQKKNLPSKHTDPGMFTLPITMGDVKIDQAICDLGASINILPLSVYQKINGARMVNTEVVIQLADCSCIHQEGILENVIIEVHDFLYPVDFHVIRMTESESAGSSRILLGQPFLKTARAIIDVFNGTICLNYHGEKCTFSVEEVMRNSMDVENLHSVNVISPRAQGHSEKKLLKEEFEKEGGSGEMKKEAAEWFEDIQTQGLTDQEISAAIMNFCQKPPSAGSRGCPQVGSVKRLLEKEEPNLLSERRVAKNLSRKILLEVEGFICN
ncbi:hypothetical protein AAHA92_07847 [Salvia divinorum]|uniref:Uncharacterized protein n=1 Tax=Salvia divinorum TaxID=28513 RepID=A0ABD1IAZ3_SALDI